MYSRRLAHVRETALPVFLTWAVHDSLPPGRHFRGDAVTSGRAFAVMDRLLDEARNGSYPLRRPAVADMVVEAMRYNAEVLGQYELHAYAVMPNHVHMLITPAVAIPKLTKSLKGITAKRANQMLGSTGRPFWQEECYDHTVRAVGGFERIRAYIEANPVRAGLVREIEEYRWSSASGANAGGCLRGMRE